MRVFGKYSRGLALGLIVAGMALAVPAQEAPKVSVGVEDNDVYVGEPFRFQIQVDNVDSAQPPELAGLLPDFTVEYLGGSQNNTQSINIVNGRTTRFERKQYLMNYRLVASRAGSLEIPAITLSIGGQTFTTRPIPIRARAPEPVSGFKLLCEYSKDTCYAGEPITLTTTIYIGDRVRSLSVSLPAVTSSRFHSEPLEPVQQANGQYYQIPVNGQEVIAEKGESRLDGESYVTLTFKHVMVPREAGAIDVPDGTVSLEVPSGTRRSTPLDNFSLFGPRESYKQIIVPADPVTLNVLPVPEEGKPANFSGLIGAFTLEASAAPDRVNVGDPITLTLALEGSFYLRHFEMPPLQQQEGLAAAFRIPDEMAPGRIEGNRKVFTQTIRAQSDAVTEIPPIELSYFDTASGRYATVASAPIPITVLETEVVTAADAEGYQPVQETVAHVAVDAGIAHNFTGADTLRMQRFGPDIWMRTPGNWALLLGPPALFGLLAGFRAFGRLKGFQSGARTRKQALARLEEALTRGAAEGDPHGLALDALRAYLGVKLQLNPSALTFADARAPLERQGASAASLGSLEALFGACEAHRYAGGASTPTAAAAFLESVRECARTLDREIG